MKVIHCLIEIAAPLPHAFVAVVNAPLALHGGNRCLVDDLGVVPPQHGVYISPIEGLDCEVNPFHALLRHRPTQYLALGSCFPCQAAVLSRLLLSSKSGGARPRTSRPAGNSADRLLNQGESGRM